MTHTPHLLHVFPTFCAAGAQVRTATLMRAFGDEYRHTVVSCDGRTEATALTGGVDLRVRPWEPASGPMGAIRAARAMLKAEQPDLLLTYNWGSMDTILAARAMRLGRHVHHEDGFNADEAVTLKGRRNWTRRISLRSTDLIVPSSKLQTIAKKVWRLPRVHLVPNGVDAAQFAHDPAKRSAFRGEHGIDEASFVIGAVGHLRAVKNFGRLLRAAAAAPWPEGVKPHVVIVGAGEEAEALQAVADQCAGLEVTFTGHLADLAGAYSAFDVFCLSSDSEQQPISLLEAMAAEVPVAATDVGDIGATLPPEGHRFLAPLGPDVETALGDAFVRLAASPETRRELSSLGRLRLEDAYSLDAMVSTYRKIYEAARRR